VYSDQQTGVIEVKPAVKIQSVSVAPGIATAPRSVVQVPIPDDDPTDSGGVSGTVPMLSGDEEVNEGEDDDSGRTHLRRIGRHDVPGHEMKSDCTHVCVYPPSDDDDGVKCYCPGDQNLECLMDHNGSSRTFQEDA